MEDYFPTHAAGFRTHIDDIVGCQHHVLVVFYHNHGVARIAEFLQGVDEAEVIALVKTDARLVEDVEHVHQLRAYLGGQADALALSTRKGYRSTVEREVVQTHIEQETETALEFLQNLCSNLLLLAVEMRLHVFQPIVQLIDVHTRQLVDVLVVNTEMQGFAVQAGTLTVRTHIGLGELVGPLLCCGRGIAFLHHLNVFHDTFVSSEVIGCGMEDAALDLDALFGAVKHILDGFFGEVLQGCLQSQFILFQQSFQLPEYHHVLVLAKRCDASFVDRKVTVGNHLIDIDEVDIAQALASVASPLGRVEREIVRSGLLVGNARYRTHQSFAVMAHFIGAGIEYHHQAIALLHGRSDTLLQAVLVLVGYHHLVNHHFDVVVLVSVQLHAMSHFAHFAIYPDIEIALLPHIFEEFLVMSLTGSDQRSQQIDALAEVVLTNQFQNLFFGILHHLLARQVRIGHTGTGKKQTEIVVNFRGCTYG